MLLEVTGERVGKDSKIVGGSFVKDISETPWIVSVQTTSEGHLCGASLVTSEYVLTACHCLSLPTSNASEPTVPDDVGPYRFVAGVVNFDDMKNAQIGRARRFLVHPKCGEFLNLVFDYALAEMMEPFIINERVHTVKILTRDENLFGSTFQELLRNPKTECYVVGWGVTRRGQLGEDNRGHISKSLKKVYMYILPNNHCKYLFGRHDPGYLKFNFTKYHQICAAGRFGNESDCEGDSGGPVICGTYQVALISYGFQCGTTTPAGYATLDVFLEWFHKEILPMSSERSKKIVSAYGSPNDHFILYLVFTSFLLIIYKRES
ncbi:hypothetical protein GE061_005610 [Apolygus lucorum]|uniref:Uncharacterized protein n=1 Tax=Apolygus lucorum TaxID=248454 RepID=A0A6A4ITI2_APOLU|nr:hypothetical protein GE061_005610 [Apolygus lucorum]